jgi:hypothetical protein
MSRADEVRELKSRGLSTRQIADELRISQTRVCQLLNTVQPVNTTQAAPGANTVQPDATTQPVNTTQANTVQPDLTALHAQVRAEFKATFEARWNAVSATAARVPGLEARIAELEAAPAAAGACPACRAVLVPVCPRCAGLDPDA